MWQVDFYIAVEREHERQRELERRRRLADVVRVPRSRGLLGRLVARTRSAADDAAAGLGGAIDRPLVGPHHS